MRGLRTAAKLALGSAIMASRSWARGHAPGNRLVGLDIMNMHYDGDIATIQRRLADTSDLHRRRLAVLDAIAMRPGERVLEVGCGGGALLTRLAAAVGPAGRVAGVDISADQIAAARRLSTGTIVEAATADVHQLPYEDASFDALVAIQVIEYLDRPAKALSELRRVSGAQGRLAVLATIWDTMFWNSKAPELTARIQTAWRQHAPHPNLPAELRPLLAGAGFRVVHQAPVPIINNAYHEDAFAYWAARLIVAFGIGRSLISQAEAAAWIEALQEAQSAGTFFFSSMAVLTTAVAA
jgi:ubiquinone/menaquinone biosynthesis C-methylase UbiE